MLHQEIALNNKSAVALMMQGQYRQAVPLLKQSLTMIRESCAVEPTTCHTKQETKTVSLEAVVVRGCTPSTLDESANGPVSRNAYLLPEDAATSTELAAVVVLSNLALCLLLLSSYTKSLVLYEQAYQLSFRLTSLEAAASAPVCCSLAYNSALICDELFQDTQARRFREYLAFMLGQQCYNVLLEKNDYIEYSLSLFMANALASRNAAAA